MAIPTRVIPSSAMAVSWRQRPACRSRRAAESAHPGRPWPPARIAGASRSSPVSTVRSGRCIIADCLSIGASGSLQVLWPRARRQIQRWKPFIGYKQLACRRWSIWWMPPREYALRWPRRGVAARLISRMRCRTSQALSARSPPAFRRRAGLAQERGQGVFQNVLRHRLLQHRHVGKARLDAVRRITGQEHDEAPC